MRKIVQKHIESLYPQYAGKDQNVPLDKNDSYPIVDQFFFGGFNKTTISPWNREDRFSKTVETTQHFDVVLSNENSNGYIAINRKFDPQYDGHITLQSNIILKNANDGARVYLDNSDGKNEFEIFTKDGKFFVKTGSLYDTSIPVYDGNVYMRAEFFLDEKRGVFYINGAYGCDFDLPEDFKDLAKVTVSTSSGYEKLSVQMRQMYIRRNYSVDESFYAPVYPCDWEKCEGTEIVFLRNEPFGSGTLKLSSSATPKKCFKTLSGKVVFESFFLLPENGDEYKIHLDDTLTVTVKDGTMNIGDISHEFLRHIWQSVRIVADTEKGEAEIYICGKIKGKVSFSAKSFSNVSFEYNKNSENGYVFIDDIRVFNQIDYPDYCPAPVIPKSKGYNAVMSVCSIWHEGSHHGYDYVAPYDECTPLLGYYDEGSVECADWETKYMLEQGISAMQYCWYDPQSTDTSVAIKTPCNHWQQYDGYFFGKYSHLLPFCVMIENAGWTRAKMTLEEFKTFLWDYWVEWLFRDPRYYRIDNKAVFHIYRHDLFLSTFGSEEACREVLDFMHEDIKKYGYDGIIILVSIENPYHEKVAQTITNMGFDGHCHYGYGKASFAPGFITLTVDRIKDTFKKIGSDMFCVPTIGTGRNIMGWEDTRTPLASPEQYAETINNAIALNEKYSSLNMMYFSTWNEYGEGHWLAPSGLNGFGYADALRKILCEDDVEVKHQIPTASQMARIAHLYNDYRTPIRDWLTELPDVSTLSCTKLLDFKMSLDAWDFEDCKTSIDSDGAIVMDGYDVDPKCIYKEKLNIKADDVDYIHVKISSTAFDSMQVFFTNEEHEEFYAGGLLEGPMLKRNEYIDIYITPGNHKDWKGTITGLRIDPSNSAALTKIMQVEFLKLNPISYDFGVVVDNTALKIPFHYKAIEDGEYYLAANPKNCIFTSMNMYHEWDRFEGKLYIKTSNDTEFIFTVGEDVALVNGKEQKLKKPFSLLDHMPVLPLKFIFDNTGISYEISDNTVRVSVR